MNKKIISFILIVLMLAASASLTVYSDADPDTELIIESDGSCDPAGIYSYIESMSRGRCDLLYIYDTLMTGLAVRVPLSFVKEIYGISGVGGVYFSEEYSALDEKDAGYYEKENLKDLRADGEHFGQGSVVAVLDSGFAVHDSYFVLSADTEPKLRPANVNAVRRDHGLKGVYVSSKIPYVYDYADGDTDVSSANLHGQHVAGIIAGNPVKEKEPTGFCGVAPEAQLLLMKIFSDSDSSSKTSGIIAALEDAAKLGADVANLSFGAACGNPTGRPLSYNLQKVIDAATKEGMLCVCASGNFGSVGDAGIKNYLYGQRLPGAEMTDFGTVASPASVSSTLAVGTYTAKYEEKLYFVTEGGEDRKIIYTDTCMHYDIGDGRSFASLVGSPVSFAIIGGDGSPQNFADADIEGKLALAPYRGVYSIEQKMLAAKERGALGVIFYLPYDEPFADQRLNLVNAVLPAILISHEDCVYLAGSRGRDLVFSDDQVFYRSGANELKIADYSSFGTWDGCLFKPDVLAYGTSVTSLGADRLETRSGTSMSSAYVSGICAALCSARRGSGLASDPETLRRIIMNCAEPITDLETGYDLSPRYQGAGKIDFDAALKSRTGLTYSKNGKPKAEISDPLSYIFSIDVTVSNYGQKAVTYYFDCSVHRDGFTSSPGPEDDTAYFNTMISEAFTASKVNVEGYEGNANRFAGDFERIPVRVEPNFSKKLRVTVFLDASSVAEAKERFVNGFYIDGYLRLTDTEGSKLASIPYVGFFPGEEKQKALDISAYEGRQSYFGKTFLYSSSYGSRYILGCDDKTGQPSYSLDAIAFSPDGDRVSDRLYLSLGLFRNLASLSYTVEDAEGRVISESGDLGFVQKSRLDSGSVSTYTTQVWDGRESDGSLAEDGDYFIRVRAKGDFEGAQIEELLFPVTVDRAAPEIIGTKVEFGDFGSVHIHFFFRDNKLVKYLEWQSVINGNSKLVSERVWGDAVQTEDGAVTEFIVNATYLDSANLLLSAVDYAGNAALYRFDMKDAFDLLK